MNLYATIDTSIYGRAYHQGELVDDTGWERAQYLQMFSLGMVTPATGTRVYNGPDTISVTPSAPVVIPTINGYEVTWDGLNDDGSSDRPVDWCWVEIHSSVFPSFTFSASTLRGTLVAAGSQTCVAGVEYVPGVTDNYEVLLVHRNTAGNASRPSARVMVTVAKVLLPDLSNLIVTVQMFNAPTHIIF